MWSGADVRAVSRQGRDGMESLDVLADKIWGVETAGCLKIQLNYKRWLKYDLKINDRQELAE